MKRKRAQQAVLQSNVINIDPRFANQQKRKRVQLYPKNLSQENYLIKLNDPQKMIVFAIGPAGTGKTLLAVQWAIDQLLQGEIKKIVITRPAVSVDEEHGFLPGTLNEKMEPWTKPIMDVFSENYSSREIETMLSDGIIEISPLAYMRGRTFKDSVIIADEMQNATPSQMKMLLTRLGQGSQMVVTGDLQQADRPSNNGLLEFLNRYNDFKNHLYVDICHFTIGDVERHEAVKEILKIYGDA
jgi:phosphate starvation-inducible PhoH-like protein